MPCTNKSVIIAAHLGTTSSSEVELGLWQAATSMTATKSSDSFGLGITAVGSLLRCEDLNLCFLRSITPQCMPTTKAFSRLHTRLRSQVLRLRQYRGIHFSTGRLPSVFARAADARIMISGFCRDRSDSDHLFPGCVLGWRYACSRDCDC